MFIEEKAKPKIKKVTENYVNYIFGTDEELVPSLESFQNAYIFQRNKLKRKFFDCWTEYNLMQRSQRAEMKKKMEIAEQHYAHGLLNLALQNWINWMQLQKKQQALAANKIQTVLGTRLLKTVIKGWHELTLDAKKARDYFERLERGEFDEIYELYPRPSLIAKDEISNLPYRVALKIFTYLNILDLGRCAQVCRFWKVLTQSNSLWNKINFSAVKNRIQDKQVIYLLQKFRPYVICLNFRGCSSLQWPSFKCVDITNGTLRMLSRCCLNLQYLSLAYCRKFTDKGLQYLATGKGCHKLIYLDLSGCTQISVDGFRFLAAGLQGLQHLEINDLVTLTDSCFLALLENTHHIASVSMLGSPYLSDIAFKAFSHKKKLSKLSIEGNGRITDAAFKSLHRSCSHLSCFYVNDCPKITDITLKGISFLKNLTTLSLADCIRVSDQGVRYFVEGLSGSKLKELNLANCIRISDVSLLRISQRCHRLTSLSLCYCDHLTDSGIELLSNLSLLTSIDLSGTNIMDQGLSSLGNSGRIITLSLSECPGITNLGLQKFCQQTKELDYLDVSHCLSFTDQCMKTLAFCCRSLTSLNIAGCPTLTDISIQHLSGVCHYLHFLDISGCVSLTDKVIKYLLKGCKQLCVLKMLYCKNITNQAAFKAMAKIEDCEFSNETPPTWFAYDCFGNLLDPSLKEQEGNEEQEEDLTSKNVSV
uniref:F-box domain-containing protein n=1 Tax=Latimeria chalumnae TaxID=7897 RepID=M3XLI2_LATCH